MNKAYTVYACPNCNDKYFEPVNAHGVQIGGLKCGCGEHFGVDAAQTIILFESEVHDCPEEGETNKITSIDVSTEENYCSYCNQVIENIKRFDSIDDYEDYIK